MQLSKDAQVALEAADRMARAIPVPGDIITTDHLLYAILLPGNSKRVRRLFRSCKIKVTEVRKTVRKGLGEMRARPVRHKKGEESSPLTPRSKKILRIAEKEAASLKSSELCPEHILLAILKDDDGGAAEILRKAGFAEFKYKEIVAKLPVGIA